MNRIDIFNKETLESILTADLLSEAKRITLEDCDRIINLIRRYDFGLSRYDSGYAITSRNMYQASISLEDLLSENLENILSEYSRLALQILEEVNYVTILKDDTEKVKNIMYNNNIPFYVESNPYNLVANETINDYMNEPSNNKNIYTDMHDQSYQNPKLYQLAVNEVSNNIRNIVTDNCGNVVENSYDNLKDLFVPVNK